jgi:hypothetical protein
MSDNNPLDQLFQDSLGDFISQPQAHVWSKIDQHLDLMSSETSPVDETFEQSLGNYQATVGANVWNKIDQQLNQLENAQRKDKKPFAIWFAAASTAAAILMFLFMQVHQITQNNNNQSAQLPLQVVNQKAQNTRLTTDSNAHNILSTNSKAPFNQQVVETNTRPQQSIALDNQHEDIKRSQNESTASKASAMTKIESYPLASQHDVDQVFNIEKIRLFAPILVNINHSQLLNKLPIYGIQAPNLKPKAHFSLDLYLSPALVASETNDLQNNLDNLNWSGKSFSYGANLKYHYKHFFLQSGIELHHWNRNAEQMQSEILHDTSGGYYSHQINTYYTYDTIGWMDDPVNPGVTVARLSSTIHTDTVQTNWNSVDSLYTSNYLLAYQNKYRYLEIPLMIGYQYDYKKWHFSFAAGASYNFKIYEHSQLLKNDEAITGARHSSVYADAFLNGLASISIGYQITESISLIVQPTFKTNLADLSSSSINIQNYSLRAGFNINI